MLNVNLKSTAVKLITQNIILLFFFGNHISHIFAIHTDKPNYCVL